MLVAKLVEKHLPLETDPDLVLRALAGDGSAFTTLYLRYVKRVSRLVGRMLRNHSESEEVTQEVFLQVHLSLPRFEGRSSFSTWIFRVAKNVTLHHIRAASHRYKVRSLSETQEAGLVRDPWLARTSPERDSEYNELFSETTRVIDGLIPGLREVMVLGPVNGGTCEEVAGLLRVTTAVIKSRLHRARVSSRNAMWRVERRGPPAAQGLFRPARRVVVVPVLVPA